VIKETAIEGMREGQTGKCDATFERHWAAHRQRIWQFIVRMGCSRDAADDLSQEICIRAFRAFPEFRGQSSFSTWLYRIAVNAVIRYRETLKHNTFPLHSASVERLPEEPSFGPEARMLADSVRPVVWQAIERLPEDLRATLVLQVYEGLKYREIAEVLNISLDLVKYRRHQAMLRLREELKDYEM